jgi:hypothetical protein
VEDWERFFQDKSRRRSDKERRKRRRRGLEVVIAGLAVGAAIVAAIMGLSVFD